MSAAIRPTRGSMAWLAPQVSTRSFGPGRSGAPGALFSVEPFIFSSPSPSGRVCLSHLYHRVGIKGPPLDGKAPLSKGKIAHAGEQSERPARFTPAPARAP